MKKMKTEPTYYTNEMRRIARENIEKYDWARKIRDEAVARAEKSLQMAEIYCNFIIREGIPRNRHVGYNNNSNYGTCRYCGVDVQGIYGFADGGGFDMDLVNHPYKIQCMDCKRWFPTNDFGSFYKLGLDEYGKFDYDKAWAENDKLIASGHPGYLVNELYPEKGKYWGVDDGFGTREYKDGSAYHKYIPNDPNLDKSKSAVYIPMFFHDLWKNIWVCISRLAHGYIYTGDIKYARAGAILLDRVADVVPEYNFRNFCKQDYLVTCGGTGYGIFVGRINECLLFSDLAIAADSFFPMLDDPELIQVLSQKAKRLGLENDKSSGAKIWKNWRDNILAASLQMAKDGRLKGNYGLAQNAIAVNATVLAEEPESAEMMAWIYKADTSTDRLSATGGNLISQIMDVANRDGFGNEASPYYHNIWLGQLAGMANQMVRYKGEKSYNPYEHPKFAQLFLNWGALVQSDYYTAHIGDAGEIVSIGLHSSLSTFLSAWNNLKDTPLAKTLAEYIYTICKGNLSSMNYGIFVENPESLKDDILALVDIHGRKESEMLPGYGYGTLKDGFTNDRDSMRSVWMFHGLNHFHGHQDTLTMGMDAFGLNFAPDTGYPTSTINDPTNGGFTRTTVAHNTVTVNKISQYWKKRSGDPYIFDDSDWVKVMGVEAKDAYYLHDKDEISYKGWGDKEHKRLVDSYNRTMVMVKVNKDLSYFVDFFRVLGGTSHTYSFHAQSHNATAAGGLKLVKQVDENGNYIGTYASPEIEKGGTGEFPLGYNYFTKVRKDCAPESNVFSVDFAISDYRGALEDSRDLHLKMTQLNNFTPDEVAIVGGHVNVKGPNKIVLEQTDTLEYVLTQREAKNGEQLDSLFTTVFEPYRKDIYLLSVAEVSVDAVAGTPGETDIAKAILVTHKNGRKDYIFYATNKDVTYRVADLFNVRGYMGVYSVGEESFRYVAGGNLIGEEVEKPAAYTGVVLGHSEELSMFDNYIDVAMDSSAVEEVAGRFVYIENDGEENAVYKIEKAFPVEGGVRLNIGTVLPTRGLKDITDESAGYIYNIEKGQPFTIPMSYIR